MTMQGSKKLPVVKLVDSLEASWDYVANEGTTFTLQTNYMAPRCRCVCSAAAVAVAVAVAVTVTVAAVLLVLCGQLSCSWVSRGLLADWEATCHGLVQACSTFWGLADLSLPWQPGEGLVLACSVGWAPTTLSAMAGRWGWCWHAGRSGAWQSSGGLGRQKGKVLAGIDDRGSMQLSLPCQSLRSGAGM